MTLSKSHIVEGIVIGLTVALIWYLAQKAKPA